MKYVVISIVCTLALVLSAGTGLAKDKKAAKPQQQAGTSEQQAGSEMVFTNVDQVQERPSDIHIGSDPYYKEGMEKQVGGSDSSGYTKDKVERDRVIYEEDTTYKVLDKKHKAKKNQPEGTVLPEQARPKGPDM